MNCELARNRMLAAEVPTDLNEELSAHVESCSACGAWHRKYLLVDKALASIPVPEHDGARKMAVIEKIRSAPASKKATARPAPSAAPVADSSQVKSRPLSESANHKLSESANHKPMPLRLEDDLPPKKGIEFSKLAAKLWPAGLVAATLLIATIAYLSIRSTNDPQPVAQAPTDPMLENIVKLNVKLAKSETPKARLDVLGQIAESVSEEMRDIARADDVGDNMKSLEEMYKKVLDGLITQAKIVSRGDRADREALKKLAHDLTLSGQNAEKMAAQAPKQSAEPLRGVADKARESHKVILTLIKEA